MLYDRILNEWVRKPENVPKFECVNRTTVATATTITVNYIVPDDYDLHTWFMSVVCAGTGAQTVSQMYLCIIPPSMTETIFLNLTRPVVGLSSITAFTPIVIQSKSTVRASADFSAGAVTNSTNLNIHGVLVPRLEILTG